METASHKGEDLFRMLASSLPAGVFLMDQRGRVIFTNAQWDKIFGMSLQESLTADWNDYLHPDDLDRVQDAWNLSLKELSELSIEFRILVGSNQLKWVALHSNVVLSDDGANVVGTVVDITEQKLAEIALRNAQAQLLQSEKLAGIGQLAAGIAHEINNPVGFVASNTTSLSEYVTSMLEVIDLYQKGTDYETIKKREKELNFDFIRTDIMDLIKENKEGLTRIMSIVHNLKDFSRIDKSNMYIAANINDSISNTLIVARNEVKYHADVVTEFGDIPPVLCNISEINQVFLNIIINAAQAIESQERSHLGKIAIKTYQVGEEVACEISDDGPGIPEEAMPRIFDPFFTTKDVGKGTGLGLSITYDIVVNKHKGHIQVQTSSAGTTFIIRLPIHNDI